VVVSNKLSAHERINGSFEGKNLEGWIIDMSMLVEGALDSKYFFIEILKAPTIYNGYPKQIENIKKSITDVYLPHTLLNEAADMLFKYANKKLKTKNGDYLEKAAAKVILEPIRMSLDFKSLIDPSNLFKNYTIEELLKFSGIDSLLIQEVAEKRRGNPAQDILITKDLQDFIEKSLVEVKKKLKDVKGLSDMKKFNERKKELKKNLIESF